MSTQVILIRHGETVWNSEHRMQGQRNSALSQLGRAQARALAQRLQSEPFDCLYSSDLDRALETARVIADATGHRIRIDARLRERCFGIFEGLTRDEMKERHPDEYARFRERDPDYCMPGGESARAFHARCMRVLHEIAAAHVGQRVVVVAHGLLLVALYRAAHALELNEPRTPLELINASLNVFGYSDERWSMLAWADQAHLQDITNFQEDA
jgi:probable phosphoglycerate mutase